MHNQNKKLLASALQKSMRRGLYDCAINYSKILFNIDKQYLTQKLQQFAIYDVGFANPPLTISFITAKDELSQETLPIFIDMFCNTIKDRTIHELVLLAKTSYHERKPNNYNNKSLPLIERFSSILSSSNIPNENEAFLEIMTKSNKLPETLKIFSHYHEKQHFPLPILALPLIEEAYCDEKGKNIGNHTTGTIIEEEFTPSFIDGQMLLCAFDDSFDETKNAIQEFHKLDLPINNYLRSLCTENEQNLISLGHLLYRAEGHKTNKRLFYPTALKSLKMTEHMTFKATTMNPTADFELANKLFKESITDFYKILQGTAGKPNPSHFPF